jgi:hypothetical protein
VAQPPETDIQNPESCQSLIFAVSLLEL